MLAIAENRSSTESGISLKRFVQRYTFVIFLVVALSLAAFLTRVAGQRLRAQTLAPTAPAPASQSQFR